MMYDHSRALTNLALTREPACVFQQGVEYDFLSTAGHLLKNFVCIHAKLDHSTYPLAFEKARESDAILTNLLIPMNFFIPSLDFFSVSVYF